MGLILLVFDKGAEAEGLFFFKFRRTLAGLLAAAALGIVTKLNGL